MGTVSNKRIQKPLLLLTAIVLLTGIASGSTSAINYNAEIKKLQNQNATNEQNRQQLQGAALTLEAKITNLKTTIAALDNLIRVNESQRAGLTASIAAHEAEIAKEREALKVSVRKLYITSDMSMMEKMASSRNLSDFVEKEQFEVSAQESVQDSMDAIKRLQEEQKQQKAQIEQLLEDNRMMQGKMAGEKQEVDRLLALNQSEQAQYSQNIASNNSQIGELERQQAEENARFLREQAALAEAARKKAMQNNMPVVQMAPPANVRAVSGGSYPWANAPWPNDIPDPWGMYQRQCVSYTAWKVSASGRHMPYWGGRGNAKQWDDNARAAGIPVDGNPRVGDIGVRNAGTYGHVVYVEAVNSDGSIRISQYNASWDGRYSEVTIFPGDLVFIHF
ncbi:MAG TPA: CHAP domain-containing protein [Candidatus Saccharimonadales bacterium]|nr:CHAP domain-containing protein [Candidatus Saccharimonadales bacterium]